MKKFATPLLIVLAIVTAVAINAWRGASATATAVTAQWTTTSNQLAEATAKLAGQGATAETLRVQLGLQKTDLAAASNHIGALAGQVSQATARTRDVEGQLQNRTGEMGVLNRTNAELAAKIKTLEARATSLQSLLETAQAQTAEVTKRLESTAAALNEAESAKAALLAKLGDPSALRAQMESVTAAPAGPKRKTKAPLVLNPDGSVSSTAVPEPEPPAPSLTSPKFRL